MHEKILGFNKHGLPVFGRETCKKARVYFDGLSENGTPRFKTCWSIVSVTH